MRAWKRWLIVALFAMAMAWVESAVVVYLRTLLDRLEPYQPNPLPEFGNLGPTELVRELATLVMLFTIGWLAGQTPRSRFAYAMIAFGVWDIFYYLFLNWICGWPTSLWDWDILFLLPLPWWGPVLAPVSIAALMIVGGTLVAHFDTAARPLWPGTSARALGCGGAMLALYVFMRDALAVAEGGVERIRNVLPATFNWPLFLLALAMMTSLIVDL
ncbi:MAG: hypothetical protein HY674_21710, partial [Chloroflexi bacterium]|nr:hypothetical protein [Chloroflexota bacterium]